MALDEDNETLTLEFPSSLTSSCGPLHIEYTGTLNDQMRGFYRSKYTSSGDPSEERYAAVTQFEVSSLIGQKSGYKIGQLIFDS